MDSPMRRRPLDIPKPAPEAGLAEWTSKIKALQREVDADEDTEQRRLEEEIRASRLARSRRSGGSQALGAADRERLRSSSPAVTTTPFMSGLDSLDRQTNLNDTLRKLAGDAPSPSPSPAVTLHAERKASVPAPASKPEPVSLAAFIGGRASGPRLNRPAAQPDAHDPSLFVQRTRADIVVPHPVFGRGGVALAGLASKGCEVVETKERDEEPAPQPQDNGAATTSARNWARERTVSTPSTYAHQSSPRKTGVDRSPPVIAHGGQGVRNRMESLYGNANRSTERVAMPSPTTLRNTKSTDKLSQRPVAPTKPDVLRRPLSTTEQPEASALPAATPPPRIQTPAAPTTSRPSSTSPPISLPSLVRPVQPQPRPASTWPHIPASRPAPAFLKPAQQKDLTPSLSRLQGRGFVQSFVKLSSELEAGSSPVGGTSERAAGANSPATPTKKASVLDRWNPSQWSPSPGSSPVSASPLRKAKTTDIYDTRSEFSPSPEPKRPAPPLKAKSQTNSSSSPAKAPSKARSAHGDSFPLGSSNTLFSYIKPMKTGDAPPTDAAENQQQQRAKTPSKQVDYERSYGARIDEHGVRARSRSRTRSDSPSTKAAFPARGDTKADLASEASRRPLSHPTKDRARVRRKGTTDTMTGGLAQDTAKETNPAASDWTPSVPENTKLLISTAKVAPSTIEISASPTVMQPQEARTVAPQPRGENIRRLQDSWENQAPIGVRPLRKPSLATPSPTRESFGSAPSNTKPIKQALPGLANVHNVVPPPSPPLTPPLTVCAETESRPPSSPGRHSRIPSTGSRPTVMAVAQTFNTNEVASLSPTVPSFLRSPTAPTSPRSPISPLREERSGGWDEVGSERTITPAAIKAERRRSNYDKYANFTLPVLTEEKTPVSSPAGTLKKVDVTTVHKDAQQDGQVSERVEGQTRGPDMSQLKVHIDVTDESVPPVNAAKIWDQRLPMYVPVPDLRAISVEVLCIDGGSTVEIMRGTSGAFMFYDTEIIAVVHRAKSRASGLVATKVWSWRGRRCEAGEREERKMLELAKRYGTALIKCEQCGEPQELVHVLGGSLIVRQGKRSLWSAENTTMHRARTWAGLLLIDEVDLNVRSLCSGFSYCVSVLDTLWVWYGCGSAPAERDAALRYAQMLTSASASEKDLVEVEEGEEDEMFWMYLGEDGYARADYWKWRKGEKGVDPRVWFVDYSKSGSEIRELETLPPVAKVRNAVLVLHLAYEIFVLVGSEARGERRDIKTGLTFAQELSSHTARSKPFRPPVHVLIFPSQIPVDLRAAVRGLDDEAIHNTDTPDHMNLLTLDGAWAHIQQKVWDRKDLEDGSMMPLGVSPVI